jgi:ATP-binding cassette subfamily G (WHITE) protein 2 (SNQ2)
MSEKPSRHEDSPIEKSPIAPARGSINTITDSETAGENARNANPNGFVRTISGVDVKAAEEEFAHLQRELSGISQTSRRLSRSQSKVKEGEKDVEKVGTSESTTEAEPFDLEHTLRGNHTVSILQDSFSLA